MLAVLGMQSVVHRLGFLILNLDHGLPRGLAGLADFDPLPAELAIRLALAPLAEAVRLEKRDILGRGFDP